LKSHILFFSEFFRFFDLANCESHVMVMSWMTCSGENTYKDLSPRWDMNPWL
jgi:hypothetical protein